MWRTHFACRVTTRRNAWKMGCVSTRKPRAPKNRDAAGKRTCATRHAPCEKCGVAVRCFSYIDSRRCGSFKLQIGTLVSRLPGRARRRRVLPRLDWSHSATSGASPSKRTSISASSPAISSIATPSDSAPRARPSQSSKTSPAPSMSSPATTTRMPPARFGTVWRSIRSPALSFYANPSRSRS